MFFFGELGRFFWRTTSQVSAAHVYFFVYFCSQLWNEQNQNQYNNKMKNVFTSLSAVLVVLAVACVSLFTFTSCSDDDDDDQVFYTMGFTQLSSSDPEGLEDTGIIETTYKEELNVEKNSFTKKGTNEACDKEVREACVKANERLKGKTWKVSCIFQVINAGTRKVVYEAEYKANDENFI